MRLKYEPSSEQTLESSTETFTKRREKTESFITRAATPAKVDEFVPRNQHVNLSIVCQPRAATLSKVDAFVPQNKRVNLSRVCQPHQPGARLALVPIITAKICVKHICTTNRTKVDEFVPRRQHVNLRIVWQPHQPGATYCISKNVVINAFLPKKINT